VSERPTLLIGDLALIASMTYKTVIDICELWNKEFNTPLIFAILMVKESNNSCSSRRLIEFLEDSLRDNFIVRSVELSRHWVKQYVSVDSLKEYLLREVIYRVNLDILKQSLNVIRQVLSLAR